MALQEGIKALSYAAKEAIEQYVFVKASTTAERTCELATAPADEVIGVTLINAVAADPTNADPAKAKLSGHAVGVVYQGIAKVKAGGAVAVGDKVGPNAKGKAAPGGTAGVAITSAAAEDEIVEVQLSL